MYSKILVTIALGWLMAGCASHLKKADIASSANPTEEIAKLQTDINTAYAEHADVLAEDDLQQANKYLNEAKSDLTGGESQEEVIDDLRYGQGFVKEAKAKSTYRQKQIQSVVDARQKAIDAGARNYGATREQMLDLDNAVRDYADHLDKTGSNVTADLQRRYLTVELNAIKEQQLGKAAAQIDAAKRADAARYTPVALNRAVTDFNTADALIVANRNDTASYADAVGKSRRTAELLTAVLAATNEGRVDEATASKIVMQDRKIKNLEGELDKAGTEAEVMSEAMANQGKSLSAANAEVNMQKSLENARAEFGPDEADVFQQGDQLVIRLKSMNFPTGRADVPSAALPVLSKVKDVASDLHASEVRVEGHTDSLGSPELNKSLSEERANSISKYLETNGISSNSIQTVGYGFEKPIASNKTKTGRAMNRRVDIVITPSEGEAREPAATSEGM
jgi:outer membrane protein OmpA-like peptidoglycan-associated protein